MTHGDRVRIKTRNPYSGMPDQTPFSGKTGTIVGTEFDGRTRMYRVRLDTSVHVPGVGLVADDLWSGKWLSKVRQRSRRDYSSGSGPDRYPRGGGW